MTETKRKTEPQLSTRFRKPVTGGSLTMFKPEMTRSQFLRGSSCFAAGAILGRVIDPESARCEEEKCPNALPAAAGKEQNAPKHPGLTLRPYQLLCAVCSLGQEESGAGGDEKLKRVHEAIRENPDIPVKLVCNVADVFAYQDPGPEDDRHGSPDFNRKRDLEVLQRLDLPPGITLPARIILHRLWDRIESVSGICGYDAVTSEAWRGCPKAKSGFYEKGRKLCLSFAVPYCGSQTKFCEADLPKAKNALIVPRTKEERDEAKRQALEAMYKADAISVRPHNLVDAVGQYGAGRGPGSVEDNLPELIQLIIKKPETKIRLAPGAPWMICAPCPSWVPKTGACLNVKGYGGMTNQYRDVRMLQKLGLKHGDVMNARELYRLIFQRANPWDYHWDSKPGSLWHDSAPDPKKYENYKKGKDMLMREFGFAAALEKAEKPA